MFLQCGMYYKFLNSHNTFSKVYDSLAYLIKLTPLLKLELRARYMSSMYVRQEQSYRHPVRCVLAGNRACARCGPQL